MGTILDPGASRIQPNIAEHSIFGWIQDPRSFQESLGSLGSWIQSNKEYSAIFERLLDPRLSRGVPEESLILDWIRPNIEYLAVFGSLLDPRLSPGVPHKSWILDPAEHGIRLYSGGSWIQDFCKESLKKSWILDPAEFRICGYIRLYAGCIEKIRVRHVYLGGPSPW